MKALNNFCAAAGYAALAEALVLGENFGLTPSTIVEIVNSSTGRSFVSEVVFGQEVVTGRYDTGFALGLLAKDVTIAAGIAEGSDVAAPMLSWYSGDGPRPRRRSGHRRSLGGAQEWWGVDLSDATDG